MGIKIIQRFSYGLVFLKIDLMISEQFQVDSIWMIKINIISLFKR